MAEQLDLSINIGANTQDFQGALQKAQNLLGQFQAALKKATNVGEINYLNNQIANLNKTIAGINSQMNNIGRPAADATNALSNLSRVAQDAPYGFMGIANNLNPLLESFQRLQKESGGTGNAMKSLVSGLTGPAGIGLALGVVSSLIVAFGDDIGDFISDKINGLGKAFNKETELIQKGSEGFVKAKLELVDLNNEFTNYTNGISTKDSFLKKFNDTLGDTIGKTENLATAEKFLGQYADKYVEMTYKKTIANLAAAEASKKQFEAEIAKNKPNKSFTNTFENLFFEGKNLEVLGKVTKDKLIKSANEDEKIFETIRKKYQDEANKIQGDLSKVFGKPEAKGAKGAKGIKATDTFSSDLKRENNAILEGIKKRKELGKTANYITQQTPEDKAKAEKQRLAGIKLFGESKMTGDLGKSLQGKTSEKAKDILLTQQQTDANLQLADTLSNYATNAFMNLFNSMEQGMGLGEALGNMFIDLAKQIAAAAIKAAAFQAILSLIPGGAGAKVASGGFGGIFKSILGLASGGVVNGPTLAMIGEGSESEAVMPLSKLGSMMQNTFNAGAMASNGGGGNGEFVLRGQDLVLAMNRSETSLKYRRG